MEEFINYKDQADYYISLIKEIQKDTIGQVILYMYSLPGFIHTRITYILKERFSNKCHLNAYLIILLSVMKYDGINNCFSFFYSRNLVYEDFASKKKFIRIYKDVNFDSDVINEYRIKLENQKIHFYNRIRKKKF